MFHLSNLALRNLRQHKLRNGLTALAICVAIALVVGLGSAFEGAYTQVQVTLSAASGPVDILVRPTDTNTTMGTSLVTGIRRIEGVAAVAGRIGADAGLWKGGKKYQAHIIGVAEDDFVYNDPRFTKITGDRALGTYGIVVDSRIGIPIGTSVTIRGYSFKVVGTYTPTLTSDVTVSEQEYYYAFITLERAQLTFDKAGSVDYALVRVVNLSRLEETAESIRKKYEALTVFEVKKAVAERAAHFTSSFYRSLRFMALVAFVLGSFICFNTAYLNVIERKREVGLLRAVGAGRLQIFLMFLAESIIVSLLGAAAGLLLGEGLTLGFNIYLSKLYNLNLSLPPPEPEMLVLVVELGLGSALLGGLIPAVDASRMNVISAIQHRTTPPYRSAYLKLLIFFLGVGLILAGQYVAPLYSIYYVGNVDIFSLSLVTTGAVLVTVALLETLSRVLRIFTFLLVGRLSELPINNIARNLGKSTLCLILVTVCLTFVIAVGGMESTVTRSISGTAGGFFTSDLILYSNIGFPTDFPDELSSSFDEIAELAGVRVVATDVYNPNREYGHLGNSSIYSQILTVDPQIFFSIVQMSMSTNTPGYPAGLLKKDRTCLISKTLAQSIHMGIGDDLGIRTVDKVYEDEELLVYKEVQKMHKLTIVGIIDDPNMGFLWFGGRPFDEMVITSFDSLESLYENALEPPDLTISNLIFIKVSSGYETQIQSLKERILEEYGQAYSLNIYTRDDLVSMVRGNIDDIFNLFYLSLAFSLVVAAVGMANVMTISVAERSWEVYLLRAIGASRRQVSFSFYAETFALSMIGLMVGLVTGLLFWSSLSAAFLTPGLSILSILPLSAIEWAFYAVIGVTIISGSYPAWKASKILPVGRIIGVPEKKMVESRRPVREGGKRPSGLSEILFGRKPVEEPAVSRREKEARLKEIAQQIREGLRLKRPLSIVRLGVSKGEQTVAKTEPPEPRMGISPQLAKRLRTLESESQVLSFLVPDNAISEIAESMLRWLPEGTRSVEATTAEIGEQGEKLVNAVVILRYGLIAEGVEGFLTDVPKGSFRVVLVPSSTYEQIPEAVRSAIQWSLETHIGQKRLRKTGQG